LQYITQTDTLLVVWYSTDSGIVMKELRAINAAAAVINTSMCSPANNSIVILLTQLSDAIA